MIWSISALVNSFCPCPDCVPALDDPGTPTAFCARFFSPRFVKNASTLEGCLSDGSAICTGRQKREEGTDRCALPLLGLIIAKTRSPTTGTNLEDVSDEQRTEGDDERSNDSDEVN